MWKLSILGFDIYHIFYFFFIYSFFGWLMECTVSLISTRNLVNRGFLNGPICPIYGIGVVFLVIVLSKVKDNFLIMFLIAITATTILEYATGYILEKSFHTKWWDYSSNPLNLHGRICLGVSLIWGVFSVFLVKNIHPYIESLVDSISLRIGKVFIIFAIILFSIDFAYAIYAAINLNERLKAITLISEEIKLRAEKIKANKLPTAVEELQIILTSLTERYEKLINKRIFSHDRILKAFPRLKSIRFDSSLDELRERVIKIRIQK